MICMLIVLFVYMGCGGSLSKPQTLLSEVKLPYDWLGDVILKGKLSLDWGCSHNDHMRVGIDECICDVIDCGLVCNFPIVHVQKMIEILNA